MKVDVAEYGIEQIIEFFNHVISSRASLKLGSVISYSWFVEYRISSNKRLGTF